MGQSSLVATRSARAIVVGILTAAIALLQAPAFALDAPALPGAPGVSATLAAGTVEMPDADGYLNAAEAAAGTNPANWTGPVGAVSAEVWFEDSVGVTPAGCGRWSAGPSGLGAVNAPCAAALPEGEFFFKAEWSDGLGNTSDVASTSLIKDSLAPAAPSVSIDTSPVNAANAAAVAVSGTTEAGASVLVSLTDGVDSVNDTVTADGTGAFTATLDASALADGTLNASAVASDAASNPSAAGVDSVLKDATAAAAGVNIVAAYINLAGQDAVGVAVTGEPGSTVDITMTDEDENEVSAQDVAVGTTATIDASSLQDGTITASAVLTDAAGNVAAAATDTAIKDTVAPVAGTLTFDDGDGYINAAEAATNLPVTWDGPADAVSSSVWFATADGTIPSGCGPWASTVDNTGALPNYCTPNFVDGEITFRGTWTDAAGNVGAEGSVSSIIDRAGTVDITSPAPSAAFAGPSVVVSGTAEIGSTIVLKEGLVTLGTATAPAGTWSITASGLIEGAHNVVAEASDVVGNASTDTTSFSIDHRIPVIVRPAPASLQPGIAAISGTGKPASVVEVFEVQGTTLTLIARANVSSSGGWVTEAGFSNGAHKIRARGIDALGALSPYTPDVAFVVDSAGPTVAITTANGAFFPGDPEITGTAKDLGGKVAKIELRYFNELLGGLVLSTTATCANCGTSDDVTWTHSPAFLPGYYRVEAVAVDQVGQRSGAVSRRFTTL